MTQRALDSEDKQARRDAILAAARGLFLQDTRNLPSVARIAEAAGLAKGTVYLYFCTKEEIFMGLLWAEWLGLLQEVHDSFSPEGGSAEVQLTRFMQRYVCYLDEHPELMRLDAMAYSVLEQNLGLEQLRAFKLELTQGLVSAGASLEAALGLPAGRGLSLLTRAYALTRGLWQSLDYPDSLCRLLDEPVFAPIRPDFRTELLAALGEYWRGALATP
ncbi:TetR family transcriptional regulator [Chitinimonas viridis]|uniref:TetR family transcriptional regulator n=1 Tax=Chitinimonas viridis TaxID=664880 RepID=A0ABT8B1K1_9NEIS|nr:TetR family transcriptional regulator [Chitinimonas viridis]MDN3576082.1 TetR family transcriptional regulator [Chitinimonas viridis]